MAGDSEEGLSVVPVSDRRSRRDFLDVPVTVYQGDPNWIAPLRFVEAQRLNPARHPLYRHGEAAFWVARHGSRPVGRIGALVNRNHLARHDDATGHFAMLEAIDDNAVFAALLGTAEAWLRERGLRHVAGPYNLSLNEEAGLLVDGFDTPPMFLMGHGRPWHASHLAACGYRKEKDLVALIGDVEDPSGARLFKGALAHLADSGIRIRSASRSSMARDLRLMLDVYHDAWAGNWGFVPPTEGEAAMIVRDLRRIVRPEALLIAEKDGEALAIMAGVVNVNEALRGCSGRMLPFGWARLLWALYGARPRAVRLLIGGVRRVFQNSPMAAILAVAMLDRLRTVARSAGLRTVEVSWILEDNRRLLKFFALSNFERYKTYRIFGKPL